MLPGRDRPHRPLVEPQRGALPTSLRVNGDVLMQTFLDVCCQELLYYAAFVAVVRENRNFGINRYFTEHSLTYLIRADATLQNPSGMLRRTLLVLLCRTWCVRRCRLSVGFISHHLVYAVLGTSMP